MRGNKRVMTIIGIILAASSASLIGSTYAWDGCLIGAERSSSGGDLHLENVEQMIQSANIVIIGNVKNVERKIVDESYTLSFNATGYSESIVNIIPYRFVTIDVEEYLVDKTGSFSEDVTFGDDTGGCSVIGGRRANVQMQNEVTYNIGERALFVIYAVDAEDTPGDYDTGFYNRAEGALHKYVLKEDGSISNMAMERYNAEPVKLSDIRDLLSKK